MRKVNYASALTESATLTLALSAMRTSPVYASGFIGDSPHKGNLFYWQHQRDRRYAYPASEYQDQDRADLHHASLNSNPDFQSGYAGEWIGLNLAVFGAAELSDSGPALDHLSVVRRARQSAGRRC